MQASGEVRIESSVINVNTSERRGEKWKAETFHHHGWEKNVNLRMDIGYQRSPDHSVIVRRRGRVGRRERHTCAWFLCSAVSQGLLLCSLYGEGGEGNIYRSPIVLAEVVDDVVHKPCSCRAPVSSIELLARGNEIASGVHFVRAFDLTQDKHQDCSAKWNETRHTAAATRARAPIGRLLTPGSSSGGVSMMPDEE